MSRDLNLYFDDILKAIDYIRDFTSGMSYSAFVRDTRTQHACIRNLEVIGEAVKKIPEATRITHPEIPWKRIAGLRDILSHEYFGVDTQIIWDVITPTNLIIFIRQSMHYKPTIKPMTEAC
jgi:uncharacterized protein with HEPN domain